MTRLLSKAIESKTAIFNTLCVLLESESIDAITVKQLCDFSGVSKTTFYAHFCDKYEVIQWYNDLAHEVGIGQVGRTLTWEEGHRITAEALEFEAEALRKAAHSNDYNSVNPHALRWRQESLITTLTEYKHVAITPRLKMQIAGLAAAEVAVAEQYFNEKRREPIELLADVLLSIVPQDLYNILKDPACPNIKDPELEQMRVELAILQSSHAQRMQYTSKKKRIPNYK